MTAGLKRLFGWQRSEVLTTSTTVALSADSSSESSAPTTFRASSKKNAKKGEQTDSRPAKKTGFDKVYDEEKKHWSNRYADDPIFRGLIDRYVQARAHVRALKQSSTLSVKQIDELNEKLGTSLAIAFGLARQTVDGADSKIDWTDETHMRAAAAGKVYGQSSVLSNLLTQLPGLARGGLNMALDLASMYDPENQCQYQMAKTLVDGLYVTAQAYLAVMVPLWNAGWQPLNVAGQAQKGPPWQPAVVSSKLTGEDGNAAPIVAAKVVKQQWELLHKVIALTVRQNPDEKTREKILRLRDNLTLHRSIAIQQASDLQARPGGAGTQKAECVRLGQEAALLGDMVSNLDKSLQEDGTPDTMLFEKHRKLLIEDRSMGMLYGQLNVMRSAGHVRTVRNVLNGLSTATSLASSVKTAIGTAQQIAAGVSLAYSPEAAPGAMGNGTLPDVVNVPCNPSEHVGFDAATIAVDAVTFGLNLTQVLAYSFAYGDACGDDYLGKLATQFKIIGASGLGNFTDDAGEVIPKRLDAAMKGPISLRVDNIKKILEHQNSVALMALLGNKLKSDPECDLQESLRQFKQCKDAAERKKLVSAWGLAEDRDAMANLADHERMNNCLALQGAGELNELLNSRDLPESFRTVFKGSLKLAAGSTNAADADSDNALSDLFGEAKKFEDLESVLQSAQKYGQQFAVVVAGSGSPQALKALGTLIGLGLMASGKFDSASLTRVAAGLRAGILSISLLGSLVGIGLGYGYHKPIALKNAQRAEHEGETTFPNSGVLKRGWFKYFGLINWDRIADRLSDFKAPSGKTLSSSAIPIKGANLRKATREQIWATGLNSRSFASKWFKFFGVRPGKLASDEELKKWVNDVAVATKKSAADTSSANDSSSADEDDEDAKAEIKIPMPAEAPAEPAFASRRTWKSNPYSKPPASLEAGGLWPIIAASLAANDNPETRFEAALEKALGDCDLRNDAWRSNADQLTRVGEALQEGIRQKILSPQRLGETGRNDDVHRDVTGVLSPWLQPVGDPHTMRFGPIEAPSVLRALRPGRAWFMRNDGESTPVWYSPELLCDANGAVVAGGYILVPQHAVEHGIAHKGPPAYMLSHTRPGDEVLYKEHQQGDYCGLHVLNMLNMTTGRDHGMLLSAAQASAALRNAGVTEDHNYEVNSLITLNAQREGKVPELVGLQGAGKKMQTLEGEPVNDADLNLFKNARVAGITCNHSSSTGEPRGHTVLLIRSRRTGEFWSIDPKNPDHPQKIEKANDMQAAARAYVERHGGNTRGPARHVFNVFFPKEGDNLWLPDSTLDSIEESPIDLDKSNGSSISSDGNARSDDSSQT